MGTTIDLDWQSSALIIDLAERMEKSGHSFGKTALQKFVYFLQELHRVDCGYDFTLYTYGPFSAQLLADLDTAKSLDGVNVRYDQGSGGYDIKPGPNAAIKNKAHRFLTTNADSLQSVVDEFGGMWAKDLELNATIIYADRDASAAGESLDDSELVSVVKDLKPHFSEIQILSAIENLRSKGHLD